MKRKVMEGVVRAQKKNSLKEERRGKGERGGGREREREREKERERKRKRERERERERERLHNNISKFKKKFF